MGLAAYIVFRALRSEDVPLVLIPILAACVLWTLVGSRARLARAAGRPSTRKPYQLNSCHVYKDDSPAVLERWPQHYTGPR